MPQEPERAVDLSDGLTKLQLASLDACVRCYACLEWCPVFDILGDEKITPPEKIRIFGEMVRLQRGLMPRIFGRPDMSRHTLTKLSEALYQCTTCGRCGEVCEVGIHTQRLWPALRAKMIELGVGPIGGQVDAPRFVAEKHNPYDRSHAERFDFLPPDVPIAKNAEVGFFVGCSGAYTAHPMVAGAVKALHAAGVEFTLFEDEYCCGFPLWVLGYRELLAELVHHNVDGFVAQGVKRLVTSCPCCLDHLTNRWPELYGAKDFPLEIVHTTQVLVEQIEKGKFKPTKRADVTVTVHDPCYVARGTRVHEPPRIVAQSVPGVRLVEMEHNRALARCCGAGGGIRRAYGELSVDMAKALIREAEETGADIMLMDCPACFERLNMAYARMKSSIKLMDLLQFVTQYI